MRFWSVPAFLQDAIFDTKAEFDRMPIFVRPMVRGTHADAVGALSIGRAISGRVGLLYQPRFRMVASCFTMATHR